MSVLRSTLDMGSIGPDQTGQMCRLVRTFPVHKRLKTCPLMTKPRTIEKEDIIKKKSSGYLQVLILM